MADSQKELKIVISADTSKAKDSINGFGTSLKSIGTIAAGLGLEKLAEKILDVGKAFVTDSIAAYAESEKMSAQLDAVLKSTAGAVGMTKDELLGLSSAFQKTTTFSDETVLSAENMLLTFTNIGKNVFPDATKAVLDMSTALGQDTKNSAIQLGKALQDPILGVSALRRVGVAFTDDQKEQIKVLVESGKTMDAQKLILAELSKEFGGSAAAAANTYDGKIKQLKNSFDDLQEKVGKVIVDAITPFIDKISNGLNTTNIDESLKQLIDKLEIIGNIALNSTANIGGLGNSIKMLAEDLGASQETFSLFVRTLAGISDVAAIAGMGLTTIISGLDTLYLTYQSITGQITDEQYYNRLSELNNNLRNSWIDTKQTIELNSAAINDSIRGNVTHFQNAQMQSTMTKTGITSDFDAMRISSETNMPKINTAVTNNMSTLAKNAAASSKEMMSSHQAKIEDMKTNTENGFSAMHTSANNWWGKIKGIFGNIMGGINDAIDKMAQNMSTPHKATGGFASGLTLVGERGPELVSLPQGSYVHDSEASKGMMGGTTININNPTVRNDQDIQSIAEAVKNVLGRQGELAAIGAY